jgi:hypothetical protein
VRRLPPHQSTPVGSGEMAVRTKARRLPSGDQAGASS